MSDVMGHYAVKNKVKIFRLFDEGKRPADIDFPALSRNTIYQYYAEWRREKGLRGKKTGFAIKKFVKIFPGRGQKTPPVGDNSLIESIAVPEGSVRDRKSLDNFILDCITIIDALKRPRRGAIYLPGSQSERFLSDILRIKERNGGKTSFLSIPQYIELFTRWMEIARKAGSKDEFYRLSMAAGIIYEAPGL